MNLLSEIIEEVRRGAQEAGCGGTVIHAEITLVVCSAPVVVRIPIKVPETPNARAQARRANSVGIEPEGSTGVALQRA